MMNKYGDNYVPRNQPTRKRKYIESNLDQQGPSSKKCKTSITIFDLPEELLLQIFLQVPSHDLYINVASVSKQWGRLATDFSLWETINIERRTPYKIVRNWILRVPNLLHCSLSQRTDADRILKLLSNRMNLETLKMGCCKGTDSLTTVHSKELCYVMRKCRNLKSIQFDKIIFNSCKFFKLLTKNEPEQQLRRINYSGPMTVKQFEAYVLSVMQYPLNGGFIGTSTRKFELIQIKHLFERFPAGVCQAVWNALLNPTDVDLKDPSFVTNFREPLRVTKIYDMKLTC